MADGWLPEGYQWGMHIERHPRTSPTFNSGGGRKMCWHITVSGWNSIDPILGVLDAKRAWPNLMIGGRPGTKHPVVMQFYPVGVGSRALAHPSGPPTNGANVVQVEICATVADVPHFDDVDNRVYKALANLTRLTNYEGQDIPRKLARRFVDTRRFSGQGFVDASGHLGHMHAPGNDHGDPTPAFEGSTLMRLCGDMPTGGYALHGFD